MYSYTRRGPGSGTALLAILQTLLLLSALVLVPASVIAQDADPSPDPAAGRRLAADLDKALLRGTQCLSGDGAVLTRRLRGCVGRTANCLCLLNGCLRVAVDFRSIDADFATDGVTPAVGAGFIAKLGAAARQTAGGVLVRGFVSTNFTVACV